jgi:hypothetical protein
MSICWISLTWLKKCSVQRSRLRFIISLGSKKKERRCACLCEVKASHSHKMWTKTSTSVPHFLQVGLLLSPITYRMSSRGVKSGRQKRVIKLAHNCDTRHKMCKLRPETKHNRLTIWNSMVLGERPLERVGLCQIWVTAHQLARANSGFHLRQRWAEFGSSTLTTRPALQFQKHET